MIKIFPSTISGQLHAPGSKAHAQRLLFMAAMAGTPTRIKNVPRCDDIDTTIDCLREMGCTFSINSLGDEIVVNPFPKTSPLPNVYFNFRDSATTAKMAITLCSALGMKAHCKGSSVLIKRKMISLTSRLALRGAMLSNFSLPCDVTGRMTAGEFEFPGNEGTQAINAVMMFASCLLNDSTIKFSTPIVDDTFNRMTANSMKDFGVMIEETADGYHVIGRQYYQSPGEVYVEADWGLATMWTMAGAACARKGTGISVDYLNANSIQKYRNTAPINTLVYQDFTEMSIDVSECPNLATLLAAIAIVKGSSIHLKGAPQLQHKECDRLNAMADIAAIFGQRAIVQEGSIDIIGNGHPNYPNNPINCHNDPWVFMSMVLASTVASDSYVLDNERGAEKIYRNFLSEFKQLGGMYKIM